MPDDPYEDRLTTFGQRLRHARLMADLTQAELARMVNVSAPTLQRLEWDQGSWETIIARARHCRCVAV